MIGIKNGAIVSLFGKRGPSFRFNDCVKNAELLNAQGVPHLCGCCGGIVASIVLIFTLLHRSGSNIEFEVSFEAWRDY